MNIDNINKAIAVMERAKARDSVRMDDWQIDFIDSEIMMGLVSNEQDFHTCGNKACFAGHIAISPEFQADGGCVDAQGVPTFNESIAAVAIAEWLGISKTVADALVYQEAVDYIPHLLYGKSWRSVRAEDVIRVLIELRDLGEEHLLSKLQTD